jgi:hypothetical protein
MKKIIAIIVSSLLLCFLLIWSIPYIWYEVLTAQYGSEFIDLEKSIQMIGEADYLKVLEYSETFARVYYISDTGGDTLTFCKADGEWILERGGWKTVWSKSGNADGFIWPYFYHSSEGIGVILLLPSTIITVIAIGAGVFLLISRFKSKLR